MERFGLARLLQDQVEPPSSPLYWALGAVFLLALFGSLYVAIQAGRPLAGNPRLLRRVRGYACLFGAFGGAGLAAVSFALLTTPFLSKRLWIVAAGAGLLATGGHLAFGRWRRRSLA